MLPCHPTAMANSKNPHRFLCPRAGPHRRCSCPLWHRSTRSVSHQVMAGRVEPRMEQQPESVGLCRRELQTGSGASAMESIVRLDHTRFLGRRKLTPIAQHHELQRRHLRALPFHRSLQDDHVHYSHLPSAPLAPDPPRSLRPLCRQYPRPSGTRHEQQNPPPARSAMVHHQVLRTTSCGKSERILHAGQGRFLRDGPSMVFPPSPRYPHPQSLTTATTAPSS